MGQTMFTDVLVQIVFGWPAILATLTVSALGVALKRPWLLLVGAVIFIPFSYYLSGAPGSLWLPILLPISLAFAGYAVYKGLHTMAWLLISPAFFVSLWLAVVVLTQNR
jgi:hypothetical protein